jgi:hypothetical protein
MHSSSLPSGFKAALEYFKGSSGNVETALEIGIAFFNPSPRLILRANQPVEAGLCTVAATFTLAASRSRRFQKPKSSTTFRPSSRHLGRTSSTCSQTNASIQFRVVLDRGIIAVKAGHPFVTREADRWNPLLKMSSKGGLTDTEKAMNQVSRCHRERQY